MEEFTLSDQEIRFIQVMDDFDALSIKYRGYKHSWRIYNWNKWDGKDKDTNDFDIPIFYDLCFFRKTKENGDYDSIYLEKSKIQSILDNLVRTGYVEFFNFSDYGPTPYDYRRTNKIYFQSLAEKHKILNDKVQRYREQLEKEMEI